MKVYLIIMIIILAVWLIIAIFAVKRVEDKLEQANRGLIKLLDNNMNSEPAKVYIRPNPQRCCYTAVGVYKDGSEVNVKIFFYNPAEQADRDYAKMCAEELADMINQNIYC